MPTFSLVTKKPEGKSSDFQLKCITSVTASSSQKHALR